MNRKKKLEKEFERIKADHKREIIYRALLRFPELYNNKLLKKYNNVQITEIEGYEGQFTREQLKVFIVEETLLTDTLDNNKGIYDKVYELCWKKEKKLSCDTEPIGI